MADDNASSDVLVFYCNGKKIVEPNPDPRMTLNTYLRYTLWLPGTKKSCAEGGCGACTAMLSYYDDTTKTIRHLAINTCLTPLCSVHLMAVTTVEGIGSTRTKLHPVQERIAKGHGSQCGFCTPGFVMSMYALLRNSPQPSKDEVDSAIVGNICRCTGYRPIVEAFQTFTQDCCGGNSNQAGCCRNRQLTSEEENLGLTNRLYRSEDWMPYDSSQDIIFPPELQLLIKSGTPSVAFTTKDARWLRPVTLQGLFDSMAKYPGGKILVGNCSVGPEVRYRNVDYPIMLCASRVPELLQMAVKDDGLFVGSAVTLTDMLGFMQAQVETLPEMKTRFYSSLVELLEQLSGVQIRNVASVGGNILSDRQSSDLRTILMAGGCSLTIATSSASRMVIFDPDFYSESGSPKLEMDEVLLGIMLPFTEKDEYFCWFKQATRQGNDSAIVNAAMRVKISPDLDTIEDSALVFGGFPGTARIATHTVANLRGRKWEASLVDEACASLIDDFTLPQGTRGGMETYKLSLALGFFFKFYLTVTERRSMESGQVDTNLSVSGLHLSEQMPFESTQLFQDVVDGQMAIDPVGRPKAVQSALEHATGEARYVDDMPPAKNELFLSYVSIKSPHAKIISVDFSKALAVEGVVDVVSAEDIPGINFVKDTGHNVFSGEEVIYSGQPIAGVLAVDEATARRAAKLVKVDYQELDYVISTEEAIEKKCFYPDDLLLEKGDVDLVFQNADQTISGEVKLGTQEHFYLETQTSLVIPGGEHGEINVYAAMQDPNTAQVTTSAVLGVPSNRVTCHTKRLGGGFGGKAMSAETNAARAAVAANKVNRPVRSVLDRQEDAIITGRRKAFLVRYRASFTKEGKLQALDWKIYANNGPWNFLSGFAYTIIRHNIDNAYLCPNVRLNVILCKTNIAPTEPLRTVMGAHSVAMMETVMDNIAAALGLPAEQVRHVNLYKSNDLTHCGIHLMNVTAERCWQLCLQRSDFTARKKVVEDFNRSNRWIKRGLSICPVKYNVYMFQRAAQGSALVNIYLDGNVLVSHGGVEMGQGLYTKLLQIASRALGIPMERIHTQNTNTNAVPNNAVTHASIGTDFNGPAVKDACETLMHRLEPYMRENPKGKWEDWVNAAYDDRVLLSATGYYKVPGEYYRKDAAGWDIYYHCWGAAATEVEIDCLTGDHRLVRTDIVMDVGDSINPAIDIGQVEGAFMQSYGLFVLEDFRMSQSGEILTKGPGTYKVPLAGNIPSVFNVSLLHNSANPRAVYSSKAVGEPPFFLGLSTLSAIKNAIGSARAEEGLTGPFRLDTPAVPERIRMACQDKFTKKIPVPEPGDTKPFFLRL